jgi:tRNA splicing ligase
MKDIREIDQRYEDFFMRLHPVLYKYRRIGHRTHVGYGAREVEQALAASGISTEEFAGILIDRDVTICADEAQAEMDQHFDELYSLRYQEFGALYALMLQKAIRRIENLEERFAGLEGSAGDAEDE